MTSSSRRTIDLEKILRGSLIENRHTCGKKSCRCARGELHRSVYFARTVKGKQVMTSIPHELLPAVASCVERYQSLDDDARQRTEINLAKLLKTFRDQKKQKREENR